MRVLGWAQLTPENTTAAKETAATEDARLGFIHSS
jgi:hypothetical protein